jgi:ferredoxin-type protein NapH
VTDGKWQMGNPIEWQLFLIGNILYYASGIILAFWLKDNRAFCKYVCPIPVIQKLGARFALLKVKIDKEKCIDCLLCEKNCPMNIRLLTYKNRGQRVLSTECILCGTCADICPKQAIGITAKLDCGFKEELNI